MKLEVDSLYYHVSGKQILSGIYMSLESSEVVGLFGRNGSGKSTFMKAMFGLLKMEFGTIRLNGEILRKKVQTKGLIKYLPQNGFLPKDLTIEQSCRYFNLSTDERKTLYSLIEAPLEYKAFQLSFGQLRLLEMLLLLYSKASFLLLDEPFTGLSPIMVERILPVIEQKSISKGILLADHLYKAVLEISTKCLLMSSGSLRELKSQEELFNYGYLSTP